MRVREGDRIIRYIAGPKSPARYLAGWSEAGSPIWTFEVEKAMKLAVEEADEVCRQVVKSGFSLAEIIER